MAPGMKSSCTWIFSKDKTLDPVPRSRLIVVSDVHAPTPTLKALLLYLLLTGLLAAYSPLGVSSVGADAVLASANSVFSTPSLDQQANSNGDAGVECADDPKGARSIAPCLLLSFGD